MDIQGLMRQAQAVQQKIQKAQEELNKTLYEGSSGGGLVTVNVTGDGFVKKVIINDSLIDKNEKEVLEDLVVAAFNDAKKKADDASSSTMKSLTNGIPLPPGLKI